jgi:YD repeat-containing protein
VTRYTYHRFGDLATMTDALGHVTTFTSYDLDGRLLSMTDPNALVTKLSYNFRGEVTARNLGGEVTSYGYDPAGQLIRMTRPDGSFLAYAYDAAHRLTGIKDAVGDRIAFTFDLAGNLAKVQVYDPHGALARARSYTYDAANRVARAVGALGQTTRYAYDPNSNLTEITDPLSHAASFAYDVLNRRVKAVDPSGGVASETYDALDHLIAAADPRHLTTSYAWNGLDEQTAVASPDTGATTRSFDAGGNVAGSTDARGLKTTYQYDALDRPTQATYADGKVVSWQYDQGVNGIGHLTTMTDRSGRTGWTYDQHGRVLKKSQTTAGKTFVTAMSYDSAGRVAAMTYPSSAAVKLSYDLAGRVSGLKSGAAVLVGGVTYQPFGPPEGWTQGNNAVYSRNFDQDGRIARIGLGGGTMGLAYDLASRITGITETGFPAKSFGYDALDRLSSYTSSPITLTYGYDADGNRTRLGGSAKISYAIAAASNRLLDSTGAATRSLGYDASGDTIVDNRAVTIFGYGYDASGRLTTAKTGAFTTAYTNDGLGERVSRSGYGAAALPGGKEEFVHDPAGHLLGEYDGNGKAIEETVWLGNPGSGPGQGLPVAVLVPGKPPYDTGFS